MPLFRLQRRSARAQLSLWNAATFAVLLIALGIGFRFYAENSLLNALTREIRVQADRYRSAQHIEMVVISDSVKTTVQTQFSVKTRLLHSSFVPKNSEIGEISLTEPKQLLIKRAAKLLPDRSGQFLYRSFDLQGKPFRASGAALPWDSMLPEIRSTQSENENYAPWDRTSFDSAAHGVDRIVDTSSDGVRLRVLSFPLQRDDNIVGVAQIAAPLSQVNRDIDSLTRALLVALPVALILAGIAGVFLTSRALKPVDDLVFAASEIRPNELNRRLPLSGTHEFDRLSETLNAALVRVEAAFGERERAIAQLMQFTADASHELRTPLTTIKANSGIALTDPVPSEEHLRALRQIDRAADRMTALVQDLLLLARTDAGDMSVCSGEVCLREVVKDAVDAILPLLSNTTVRADQISVRTHMELPIRTIQPEETGSGCWTIRGNGEQLVRLFVNLLENALRYTRIDGSIVLTLTRLTSSFRVEVRDTGCGIAPEHLPFLGRRFYRADSGRNRKHGGAGLGLAICQSIAAAHAGKIEFSSTVGEGTAVTVTIPQAEAKCHI